MEFVCDNIPFEYPQLLKTIMENGQRVAPRGMQTMEIRGVSLCARNPRKRFVSHPHRRAHPVFPIVELFWYLSGDDTPHVLSRYIPAIAKYVNPTTGRFDGAYGPRLRRYGGRSDQIEAAIRRLRHDRESRRSVISLYDPLLDDNDESLDIPCNISFQFMIRNGKLELSAYARSQDMLRGFIYDTAEWQLLQDILSGWLGVELGDFRLFIGSAHIYHSDIKRAMQIVDLDSKFDLYDGIVAQSASCSREEFLRTSDAYRELEVTIGRTLNSEFGLSTLEDLMNKRLETLENRFWKNALCSLVAYNAFVRGNAHMGNRFLEKIDNELRTSLILWRDRRRNS